MAQIHSVWYRSITRSARMILSRTQTDWISNDLETDFALTRNHTESFSFRMSPKLASEKRMGEFKGLHGPYNETKQNNNNNIHKTIHWEENIPENDAKWKYLKEHRRTDRQVFFFPCHGKWGKCESSIVKGQLERHMYRVKENFFSHELDLQLLLIKMPGDFTNLSHRVIYKSTTFTTIVKSQTWNHKIM